MSKTATAVKAVDDVLRHTTVKYLDRARAYPFVKWAGGKRAVVPNIVQALPESFGTYYEPFVGGGAVFFALDSRISKAYLSDLNEELMLTYRILQIEPEKVIKQLKIHGRKHSREYFYKLRKEGQNYQDPIKIAARFIYLNKTCYNGLYRVNKAGDFNAPSGRYKNPTICDEDNLHEVSKVLKKATLRKQSFQKIKPKEDDLIYCDPPYDETFTQYTSKGFNSDSQKALRECCDKWRNAGAYVIISNSDTELIRKIYKGYQFVEITAPRSINCKGNGRNKVSELLILS